MDFAEEEVDDDGEDPEEEVVDDIIVCLLAFVGHGGRKSRLPQSVQCWCLAGMYVSDARWKSSDSERMSFCGLKMYLGQRMRDIREVSPEEVFVTAMQV